MKEPHIRRSRILTIVDHRPCCDIQRRVGLEFTYLPQKETFMNLLDFIATSTPSFFALSPILW
jgi:hypothetical protein